MLALALPDRAHRPEPQARCASEECPPHRWGALV